MEESYGPSPTKTGDSADFERLKNFFGAEKIDLLEEVQVELEAKVDRIFSDSFQRDLVFRHLEGSLKKKVEEKSQEILFSISHSIAPAIEGAAKKDRSSLIEAQSLYMAECVKEGFKAHPEEGREAVAEVLPEVFRSSDKEGKLAGAMGPLVGSAIQSQIKNEKEKIVDALYPVIGSTIARYMGEALKDLVDRVNSQIDEKVSVRGVYLKARAKLTGVSESEILFKEGLQDQLSSIYVIHRKTGVVFVDAHRSEGGNKDKNMLGGMFTAISSFINDWIKKGGDSAELDAIEYGGSQIIFEKSGSLVAAVVMEIGQVKKVRQSVRSFLEALHRNYQEFIEEFQGDAEKVPSEVKSELQSLISLPTEPRTPKSHSRFDVWKPLLIATLILFVGYFGYRSYVQNDLQSRVVDLLSQDPFLKDNRIKVDVSGWGVVKLEGIISGPQIESRIEKLVFNEKGVKKIDFTGVSILQPRMSSPEIREKQKGFQRQIDSMLGGYSQLDAEFDIDGMLNISGFREGDLSEITQALEEDPFVTGVRDSSFDISFFSEFLVHFDFGEVGLSRKIDARLDRLVAFLKERGVIDVTVFMILDPQKGEKAC